jgi:hypothetical protein
MPVPGMRSGLPLRKICSSRPSRSSCLGKLLSCPGQPGRPRATSCSAHGLARCRSYLLPVRSDQSAFQPSHPSVLQGFDIAPVDVLAVRQGLHGAFHAGFPEAGAGPGTARGCCSWPRRHPHCLQSDSRDGSWPPGSCHRASRTSIAASAWSRKSLKSRKSANRSATMSRVVSHSSSSAAASDLQFSAQIIQQGIRIARVTHHQAHPIPANRGAREGTQVESDHRALDPFLDAMEDRPVGSRLAPATELRVSWACLAWQKCLSISPASRECASSRVRVQQGRGRQPRCDAKLLDMVADRGKHAPHLVVTPLVQGQANLPCIENFEFRGQQGRLLGFQHQRATGKQGRFVATQVCGQSAPRRPWPRATSAR